MKNYKGQGSMELLVTVGIVLAFTLPVLFLLFSVTSIGYENTAKAQADASARSLADTMNFVYIQGPGAEKVVLLNVPGSTQSITANSAYPPTTNPLPPGGEAVITIRTSSGDFDAAAPTFAKVETGIPITATGLFEVLVINDNGEVKVVEPSSP